MFLPLLFLLGRRLGSGQLVHCYVIWGSLHILGWVRLGYWSQLLCSSLYYIGDYPLRLGLEKEILLKKIF